jgi:ketosteroid isomerase-like protein
MSRVLITFLLLLCATLSSGQNQQIEKLIRELDQKNASIVAKADTAALMALLAPEFTINRTTGIVVSGREKTLQLMRQGMVSYDSFAVQTDFVLVKSSTLAISMGSEVVISGGNRDLKGQVVKRRFAHVWTKEKGSWRLLARHANNVCTP